MHCLLFVYSTSGYNADCHIFRGLFFNVNMETSISTCVFAAKCWGLILLMWFVFFFTFSFRFFHCILVWSCIWCLEESQLVKIHNCCLHLKFGVIHWSVSVIAVAIVLLFQWGYQQKVNLNILYMQCPDRFQQVIFCSGWSHFADNGYPQACPHTHTHTHMVVLNYLK